MLKSSEILDLLKNIPEGYLSPDNKLFATSNISLLKAYKKLGAISNCEFDDIKCEPFNSTACSPTQEIFCNVCGCDMVFDNVCSYQSHYNAMHRFICSECRKSLPTEHLLDLHLSEQHDSYFKARVERGERLYKCYLEECQELFLNPQERKEHCIKDHKFPSNFRFDNMAHTNVKGKESSISKEDQTQMDMVMTEVDKNPPLNANKEYKFISFGHPKEKTFRGRNKSKHKIESGKTLENMDTLKEAINSLQ